MRGKIILILLLLIAGLIGCKNSVSEIGSGLFTNSLFSILFVDSASLKVSTVKAYDSLVTSDALRLLVGHHSDEKLGTITSKSIFQLGTNDAPIQLDRHTTEYVSLRLFLKRDGYSYYDTTKEQTISVYQLSKVLTLQSGFLFTTSRFSINSTPLGSLTFLPRPHRTDSLEIALPDELGQQIMTMAQTNDVRLSNSAEFVKFFKGIAIIPDSSSSGNMIGFKLAPEMRLYYHDNTATDNKDKFVSFTIGTTHLNPYYNYIYTDRTGTPLETLKKRNDAVISTHANNEAYLQAGTGLALRIEMPFMRDFLFEDRLFQSSRAILELMPIHETASDSPVPPLLYLYRVDGQNNIITQQPQGANLIVDRESGQNTRYSADVTAFVNTQIQTDAANNNGLLILLDDKQYRSSVNRIYIGDKKNQFAMKIKIYYISLTN